VNANGVIGAIIFPISIATAAFLGFFDYLFSLIFQKFIL